MDHWSNVMIDESKLNKTTTFSVKKTSISGRHMLLQGRALLFGFILMIINFLLHFLLRLLSCLQSFSLRNHLEEGSLPIFGFQELEKYLNHLIHS